MNETINNNERPGNAESSPAQAALSDSERARVEIPKTDSVDWILTALFFCGFMGVLFVFDVIQRVVYGLTSRRFLKKHITPRLCWWLVQTLRLTGARIDLPKTFVFEQNVPYILISNHQSMFDIPLIGWAFRSITPQYVSKIELARWIPAISFSLRKSGDVLIDRGNSGQALKELVRFGRRINEENTTAVIFPEGTRARDGILKSFKPAGIAALLKSAPRAKVIPVAIDESWKIQCHRKGPIPRGIRIQMRVGALIDPRDFSEPQAVVDACRASIETMLAELRGS